MSWPRPIRALAGFSLLELLCVLAALAVLATFTWPSYHAQEARGSRMSAMLALYRAAQYLDTVDADGLSAGAELPPGLDRAPPEGRTGYIVQRMARADGAGYEIVARPAPDGPMHNDACGAYVLRDDGARFNRAAQLDTATCWMTG
jgi:type IV pilus assembly protein PilE